MPTLSDRATKLSRRIFASLPWGFRLAHLFSKLAIDTQEAFGRFAYAAFLKAGVVGLPDIKGQPALTFRGEIQGPRAADKLPRGYGKAFGIKVWKIALAKFHNPEVVEEAISRVMMRLAAGDMQVREDSTLKSAESLIVTSVLNAGIDVLRHQKLEQPTLMREDDGDATPVDIADPHAFQELEHILPQSEMAQIMRELRQVDRKNPLRAPEWVEAKLEGLTQAEIAEQWGLNTPQAVFQWEKQYLPAIQKVINEHLREAP